MPSNELKRSRSSGLHRQHRNSGSTVEQLSREVEIDPQYAALLIIAGILTDQCIDSAARDACDLGYLVTIATDACATHSRERHEWSLRNNRGYARQRTTAELVAEIERLTGSGVSGRC